MISREKNKTGKVIKKTRKKERERRGERKRE